jgi:NADPH2:quinone reductase
VQYLLRRLHLTPKSGDTIIHAAAGGIGLIACQWARALGVNLIGTVSTEEKAARARNGAAHTIIYTKEDFQARVMEITGGKKVPIVYDAVGRHLHEVARLPAGARPHGELWQRVGIDPRPGILAAKGSLYVTRPTLIATRQARRAGGGGELSTWCSPARSR